MESSTINKLKEALTGYLKVKIELLKLDITEHLSKVLAQVIALMIIFIVALFVLAFASLTLANFLNGIWDSTYLGYLVLTGIYVLLLFIVIYLLKSGKMKHYLEDNIVEEEDDSNS